MKTATFPRAGDVVIFPATQRYAVVQSVTSYGGVFVEDMLFPGESLTVTNQVTSRGHLESLIKTTMPMGRTPWSEEKTPIQWWAFQNLEDAMVGKKHRSYQKYLLHLVHLRLWLGLMTMTQAAEIWIDLDCSLVFRAKFPDPDINFYSTTDKAEALYYLALGAPVLYKAAVSATGEDLCGYFKSQRNLIIAECVFGPGSSIGTPSAPPVASDDEFGLFGELDTSEGDVGDAWKE